VADEADVVVVGAGVIGLTTAICAAGAGLKVRVLTPVPPAETTSVLASAMVGPTFGFSGPRVDQWEHETVEEVRRHTDAPGVHLAHGLFASRMPDMIPPTADRLPGYRLGTPEELPDGFASGVWAEVPLINMPQYIEYLHARTLDAGADIEVGVRLSSIRDAFRGAPRVANCSGLAARDLVPDPSVVPLRGPKVVVRNPGLESFFIDGPPGPEGTNFFPHGDVVVLGGSVAESDDVTPDPAELAAIVERCARVEPRLRDADIIEHRVGLRPGRPTIRLEAEAMDGGLCVHNYGHGGIGVTTAWGCAREATRLLVEGRPG
jgi:D-amino-acid oxidase